MIYGQYWSHWTTVDTAKFANTNNTIDIEFIIIRARGGGKDDSRFTEHRNQVRVLQAKSGSMIWGADAFLGYVNSGTGKQQAEDFWNLINAGGKEWEINPELDVEFQPNEYNTNGTVKNYHPVPTNFVNGILWPAVDTLSQHLGHRPTIYANLNVIKEFFTAKYTQPIPDWLVECPLHIASYNNYDAPVMNPADKTYWTHYQMWQFTNTTTWAGASSICLEKRLGTRVDLKEWNKNPTATFGPGDTTTPEPPVPPTPPTTDIEARITALEAKIAAGFTGTVTVK